MIEAAREIIARAGSIVSFSGAGLSAESGVPTFRDAATHGFWVDYDPQKLASPEGFRADPELVYKWYSDRRRNMASVEPNPAHHALAGRPDIINVTQNIDDLLHRAGAKNVIQLHGSMKVDRCNSASCRYREDIDIANPPELRRCSMCGDWMRPDVVWFGEMLPTAAWTAAEDCCRKCEVLLVIGTSAAVYPAAGLIQLAKYGGAKIIIVNTEPSAASSLADVELIGKAGEIL
ncbi:MAG: NAD-dependent deacylase, partial [Phycisphaerales bacterium]